MTTEKFNISPISDVFPNTFRSSSWSLVFSNLPSIDNFKDMRYFHNMAKSITIPDYNMNVFYSDVEGWTIRHPEAPKPNKDLGTIQITFKMAEDMKNYFVLLDLMRQIKYGQIQDAPSAILREYTIKEISVFLLDNQARHVAKLGFTNAFLTSLSTINLDMGSASEVDFTCNFSYEELIYKPYATAC